MFLILLASVALGALGWVYVRWRRVRSYWAERGVPHLAPHPVWGSLTFLSKQNAGLWMRDMYKKFPDSPYIGIWLFWRPALIINSPEIARNVLVKDSDNFRDKFLQCGKNDPIGQLNLLVIKDPVWSSLRRRLTALFTSAKLRNLHDLCVTKNKELVQRIKNDVKNNKFIELRDLYSDYTTDVFGASAFGVATDAVLTGDSPMRRVTKSFQEYSFVRGVAWCCIFFLPELVDVFRFTFFPKDSTDYFRRIFHKVVEQRGGYDSKTLEGKDLVDALIKIKQDAANNNEDMDEEVIIAQACIFLQGGFDTTASLLAILTYELAYNQDIQEKLYQELLEAKRNNNGSTHFDESVYPQLIYLNGVIKEGLRKYPAMGWLDRMAAKEYKIDENLTIPAGMPVYVNGVAMHVDPKYYPDPEEFIPDRFLPENEKNITAFTYMPFGEGPRICIGKRLSEMNTRHVLTSLMFNFKLRPLPGAKKPSDCEVEKRGLFWTPGEPLAVQFVPRL